MTKGFWDVMRLAGGPVIASHSNAQSICPAMRNLSDDMLKEIAGTDGLVGMNSLREFIDESYEEPDRGTSWQTMWSILRI